jgi:probable rRNA maturation factor
MPDNLFHEIKKAVLGSKYDLSLVFISAKKIQNLNKTYRKINKPTDILSFPLSKTSGEMFICLSETKKMAKEFERPYENFLYFLFIHGCVHLKGYDHGSKMEKLEEKFRRKFKI